MAAKKTLLAIALAVAFPSLASEIAIGDVSLLGSTKRIAKDAFVLMDGGRSYLDVDTLRQLGVPATGAPRIEEGEEWHEVPLARRGGRYILELDASTLPAQHFTGRVDGISPTNAELREGAFLNYRYQGDLAGQRQNLLLDVHGFRRSGWQSTVITNLGGKDKLRFDLLEASVRRDDLQAMTTEQYGTAITSSGSWSNPARYFGVQFRRNFSVQPGFVTAPGLQLNGVAALPGVAEVFAHGRQLGSFNVEAGPFEMRNLYVPLNGAGTVDVQIKDVSGNVRTLSLKAIGAPQNLREGLSSYSLDVGSLRSRLDRFGGLVAAGTYAKGVTDFLTLEGRGEVVRGDPIASDVSRVGLGAVLATRLGTFSGSMGGGQGSSVAKMGYALQQEKWWVNADASRSKEFIQFGGNQVVPDQRTITAGRTFGPLTLSIVASRFGSTERKAVTANYATEWGSVFATAEHFGTGDRGLFFGANIPLGKSNVTAGGSFFQSGNRSQQQEFLAVSRTEFTGWRGNVLLDQSKGNEGARVDLAFGGYGAEAGIVAGQFGSGRVQQVFLDGAIVLDDGLHFSRRIDDSYAFVDIGQPVSGALVKVNGSDRGVTDNTGKALVPGLFGYVANRVSIESDSESFVLTEPSKSVSASRGAGVTVAFEAERPGFFLEIEGATAPFLSVGDVRGYRVGSGYYLPYMKTGSYQGTAGTCTFNLDLPPLNFDIQTVKAACS